MQSSQDKSTSTSKNPIQQAASGAAAAVSSAMPTTFRARKDEPQAEGGGEWSIEEKFETGMDKDGKPVPDAVAYIDGERMARGEKGFDDQGDLVSAALDDF
ncbi:hypothetical protein BJX99DRAFT_240037, partial [Aspergillus californicus]